MRKTVQNSGQALLIVLLAMATIATLVLSISARSVSEVSVSSREEESLRAFSAAEAGVEQALVSASIVGGDAPEAGTGTEISEDLTVTGTLGTDELVSEYSAEVQGFPNQVAEFNYPFELLSGQAASIWFVTKDGVELRECSDAPCYTGSTVDVCWGDSNERAALEVTFLYEDAANGGQLTTARATYDPRTGRRNSNNFEAPTGSNCTVSGENYDHMASVDMATLGVPSNGADNPTKLMRVKLLYNEANDQPFGVIGANNFPSQGKKVTSEGSSGESTRKIDAFLLNPEIPHIFDTVLFSPGDLSKS